MSYLKVDGHPNLYRDDHTGAIINTDNNSYHQYMQSVEKRKNMKKEIETLKNDVSEIKSLLKELINESRKN